MTAPFTGAVGPMTTSLTTSLTTALPAAVARRTGGRPEPEPSGTGALRVLAALAVPVALGLARPIGPGTTGTAVVVGLAPFWLPPFLRTRAGAALMIALGLYLVSGFLLAWVSSGDHIVHLTFGGRAAIIVVTWVGGVGAMCWSARVIGLTWVVVLFGGMHLAEVVTHPNSWRDNPWKFGFGQPVSLLVIALASQLRSLPLQLIALAGLGAYSVLNDSRSILAMFVITAVVLIWQRARADSPKRSSNAGFLFGLAVVGFVAYSSLTNLMVSGALGQGLKDRSEAQVEASGSLLLGGRPEWTVSSRLMREHPWGFGLGVEPNAADVELGRQGFASVHLLSQQNYLYNYVFNQVFRLHSVTADMWAAAGLFGVLLAFVMAWLFATSLAEQVALRTATALQIYLTLRSFWDIGFSPIFSALPGIALALTVALMARQEFAARASPPTPARRGRYG